MAYFFLRLRQQRVWADPRRKHRTLLSFAETEEDGGRDLARAAERVCDPELRQHLERHSRDEARHASLFRQRALEVAAEEHLSAADGVAPEKRFELAGARAGLEIDVHGAFRAGLIDELGELEYVAMLHVAERKAAALFAAYSEMNAHDGKTRAVFEEILRDEKYHVAYTGTFLDKWRKQGRGAEVERALDAATDSRWLGAWKRLGVRSASSFSQLVLFALYWTLIAPFGLLARRRAPPVGWQRANGRRVGQY